MITEPRQYSAFDQLCMQFDAGLKTLFGKPRQASRERPDKDVVAMHALPTTEEKRVGRMMRVNHTGEICAQALYQGQALTARKADTKQQMQTAADEENDHLAWCEQRLQELHSHRSYLNPLWYSGALMIGIAAGIAGDKWSLGFLAETERQVTQHLGKHLQRLPDQDQKSRLILAQMQTDEQQHAVQAHNAGAAELPKPIKRLMATCAKVMTQTAYWI